MTEKWREKENNSINSYVNNLAKTWDESPDSTAIKLTEFIKYIPKNSLMQFISRYELYNLIKNIPGDILEFGVCGGRGLFSFVQSVFINEPQYQWRNIIGFDTFEGFPHLSEKDNLNISSHLKQKKAFATNSYDELLRLKTIHQNFRFMNSRDQIKLVKGDVMKTLPSYLKENKGLIVSLLYLDLDLYEPTKLALQLLWDRIPKGGIVVFDEAIMKDWEGESIAFHEILGIGNHKLVKIPYLKQFYLVKN
tara:strand:+ start:720 stop:1469 length:750 start_codon:yes stop_codon:yes gene_type:complete